jgi:hypothetical protein
MNASNELEFLRETIKNKTIQDITRSPSDEGYILHLSDGLNVDFGWALDEGRTKVSKVITS